MNINAITGKIRLLNYLRVVYLNQSLCNIYRPPSDLNENYKLCIDELSTLMEMIENKKEVIITGDFNINLLKINEKEIFFEFPKSLIRHSYFPKITFPTRFSRTTGTLIDNLFCMLTRTTFDITSGILTKSFSDHQPYFIFLSCETTNIKNLLINVFRFVHTMKLRL